MTSWNATLFAICIITTACISYLTGFKSASGFYKNQVDETMNEYRAFIQKVKALGKE